MIIAFLFMCLALNLYSVYHLSFKVDDDDKIKEGKLRDGVNALSAFLSEEQTYKIFIFGVIVSGLGLLILEGCQLLLFSAFHCALENLFPSYIAINIFFVMFVVASVQLCRDIYLVGIFLYKTYIDNTDIIVALISSIQELKYKPLNILEYIIISFMIIITIMSYIQTFVM